MRTARGLLASVSVLALAGALIAAPATAAPPGGTDPDTPWRMRHWPQTQPWQAGEAAPLSHPAADRSRSTRSATSCRTR